MYCKNFELFFEKNKTKFNTNSEVTAFQYLYTAKINKHFMEGTFSEGLSFVPDLEKGLKKYTLYIDSHRILIFYYKIAYINLFFKNY